jgi:hypothetical protein
MNEPDLDLDGWLCVSDPAQQAAGDMLFLMDHAGAMVEVVGPDGRLLFINAVGRVLLGIAGPVPRDVTLAAYTDGAFVAGLPAMAATGRWQGEVALRRLGDGVAFSVERRIVRLAGDAGVLMVSRPVGGAADHGGKAIRRANLPPRSNWPWMPRAASCSNGTLPPTGCIAALPRPAPCPHRARGRPGGGFPGLCSPR